MPRKDPSEKLPVPGPWQPAVLAAMEHLADRLERPRSALAVTRVQESEWSEGPSGKGLEIWLMAEGRTFRYRAASGSDAAEPEPAGA